MLNTSFKEYEFLLSNYLISFSIDKELLKQVGKPVPGSLVVEPYSWKRIASSAPMLKIRTTGIKSVVLNLPPGLVYYLLLDKNNFTFFFQG